MRWGRWGIVGGGGLILVGAQRSTSGSHEQGAFTDLNCGVAHYMPQSFSMGHVNTHCWFCSESAP